MDKQDRETTSTHRGRWAAIGAAIAVSLGAGGFGIASATVSSGERAVFVPITPCRVMDTRPAPDTVGSRAVPLGAADTHTITVVGASGNCNVSLEATGVVMNVTVVNPSQPSFLTVFPGGITRPLASNLNFVPGQAPTPNAVTVDVPASGQVSFYNEAGTVDVIADIVGYYADHNHDDRYYTKTEMDALLAPFTNSVAAFASTDTSTALTGSEVIYQTVTLLPPADGVVIVNSQAHTVFTAAGGAVVRCGISNTSAIDYGFLQIVTVNGNGYETISGTRAFDVTEGSLLTVNLVCDVSTGGTSLARPTLTAIFAPS
jgi:hypothetical protein